MPSGVLMAMAASTTMSEKRSESLVEGQGSPDVLHLHASHSGHSAATEDTHLTHFIPQTRLSCFWRVVASARRPETFVRDRYLRFCVPSVKGESPS